LRISFIHSDYWRFDHPTNWWDPLRLAVSPTVVATISQKRFLRLGSCASTLFSNWEHTLFQIDLDQWTCLWCPSELWQLALKAGHIETKFGREIAWWRLLWERSCSGVKCLNRFRGSGTCRCRWNRDGGPRLCLRCLDQRICREVENLWFCFQDGRNRTAVVLRLPKRQHRV